MNKITIKVYNESNNALPSYETEGSAAMDVRANLSGGTKGYKLYNAEVIGSTDNHTIIIHPNGRALIPTGMFVAIPDGYNIGIYPRSGLALKKGITIANSTGLIDSDYRGEIGIIVINHGLKSIIINDNDRIAQLLLRKNEYIKWESVPFYENLPETERAKGGFGSTGIK